MTTQSKIAPCEEEVYKKGNCVFMGHPEIPTEKMEEWVKKVAEISGQKVDWHRIGGHCRVLALGDLNKVHDAIKQLLPMYEQLKMGIKAGGMKRVPHR